MAYKWNLLLRAHWISISVWEATRLYFVGSLLGTFTPGGIGAEAYRVTALSRFRKTPIVISTIVLERFIGAAVLSIFAAIGLPVSIKYTGTGSTSLVWIIISGSTLVVLGVLVSLRPSIVKGIARHLPYFSRFRFAGRLRDFYQTYAEIRTHWHTLSAFTVLTVLEVITVCSLPYLAAKSLDIDISFGYLMCTMPLLQILLRLPVSIHRIGLQEGLFAYLFVTAGFSATDGLSISILLRLVALFLGYMPAGLMLWLNPVRLHPHQAPHLARSINKSFE